MASPVSTTSWPRTKPSVMSIAIVRTVFSPKCCATSNTSVLPLLSVVKRIQNWWNIAVRKLHIHNRAQNLRDMAVACQVVPAVCFSRRFFRPDLFLCL